MSEGTARRRAIVDSRSDQMLGELEILSKRTEVLQPKLSQDGKNTEFIGEIETLRKDTQIFYEKIKRQPISTDMETNRQALNLLAASIEYLLDMELSSKRDKLVDELSQNQISKLWVVSNTKAYMANAISTLESNDCFSEIAKGKIENTEELQRTGSIKSNITYLKTIDLTFVTVYRLLAVIVARVAQNAVHNRGKNTEVFQNEIIIELNTQINQFQVICGAISEKMDSHAFSLSSCAEPSRKEQLKKRVAFACELLPVNQFIEELCVSAISYLVEHKTESGAKLLPHLNELAYFSGGMNRLLNNLCQLEGWSDLVEKNSSGDLLLDEALAGKGPSGSDSSANNTPVDNRYWYSKLFDYLSGFFANFYSPVAANASADASMGTPSGHSLEVLTNLSDVDASEGSQPSSPQNLSPQALTTHINHRITRLVSKGEKLLASNPMDLIRTCKQRPGYYSPDIVFRLYGLFAPKARNLCESARLLLPQLRKELQRENLSDDVKAQLHQIIEKLAEREQILQSELDYSESDTLRYGTLKGFSTPRELHWHTLMEAGQVEKIELLAKLPTKDEHDHLYEFKFSPRQDSSQQYKPVWLHVHVSKPVNTVRQWLDLKDTEVQAAHLKSDAMRPLGAQWQASEKEKGRFDAVVERSAVSLDFVKAVAGKANEDKASQARALGHGKSKAGKGRRR
ncbi:MAG: hypothetical protein QE278_06925 [Limnobacter sp.]|nr:hypothetical protein [Limnobacter sp.]